MQKSKAQRILDDIMGSDRYAQVFSDRVFSDEPILRTGASAFRDRDKDRPSTGSATFVREMSATPSSGPLGAPQPPQKQIQVTPSSGAFGSPINIEYPSESNGQLKFSSGDHGNPDLPDPWLEDWGTEETERVISEPKKVSLPPAVVKFAELWGDVVVCRHCHHDCFGVYVAEQMCGVCNGGSGVPSVRLEHDVLFRQLRKMLHDHLLIRSKSGDVDILHGDGACHPFESVADETLFLVPHAEELLGLVFAAERPESGPDASGEDNAISMVSHKLV